MLFMYNKVENREWGNKMAMTPMMRQYLEIKEQNKDCILFFRLGDFYEMFFEDAITCSRELELTLTGKDCGLEERAPMCGIPFHASSSYISRLVTKGFKVAICEQVEDPSVAKGIVKRDVIKVITPGTYIDQSNENNLNTYLMAIFSEDDSIGIALTDISTGEFKTTSFSNLKTTLLDEITKINPKEILLDINTNETLLNDIKSITQALITKKDLTSLGTVGLMLLFGIIITTLLNMFFFKSQGLDLFVLYAGLVVFAGITAYDIQNIKNMTQMVEGSEDNVINAVATMGALQIYLDFINIFLRILSIVSRKEDN